MAANIKIIDIERKSMQRKKMWWMFVDRYLDRWVISAAECYYWIMLFDFLEHVDNKEGSVGFLAREREETQT